MTTASRKIKLAVGHSVGSKKVKNKTTTWDSFCTRLQDPVRTKERYSEYMKSGRAVQDRIKDVGYYVPTHFEGGVRKKRNMEFRDLVTLDIDFAEPNYASAIAKALDGYAYALHSTHKHGPDNIRLRLIVPLSRKVDGDEYEPVARQIASRLDMDWFDDTTFQFSRVMHWPSCSVDAEYVCTIEDGRWFDPDRVLEEYENWRDVTQWPVSSRQTESLRVSAEKAEDPREKRGVVGAFCRVYSVEDVIREHLADVYEETETPGRYSYRKGSTANGAVVYDDGLFLYSHHGTDPISSRLVNAFDLLRIHKFGSADEKAGDDVSPSQMPSFKAVKEFIRSECPEVRGEIAADIVDDFDNEDEAGDADDIADEFDDEDLGLEDAPATPQKTKKKADREWLKDLILDKNDQIKINLRNLTLILKNDPRLVGRVAFNEFSRDFVQTKKLLGETVLDETNGDLWTDHADILVKFHLERIYNIQVSLAVIREAIDLIAHERRFHPVRDYLESLEWDGEARVETLLVDYLGAPDTKYTRQVARKVLCAAVARIMEPGIKFDHVLILEGMQGKRKSSFVSALAKGWFTDDRITFDDPRKAVEMLKGKWIVEIPELQSFSKHEVESIKSFFSRQTDRAREAYARRVDDYPRQCIFFGTTNDEHYLRDETGNRRFWPIKVSKNLIDVESLKASVDQVWAEAYRLYLAGEKLFLDPDVEALAKREQQARVLDDPLVGQIEAWLLKPVSATTIYQGHGTSDEFEDEDSELIYRPHFCPMQVWVEVLGGSLERYNRGTARLINTAVKQLGYCSDSDRIRFPEPYGRQRGYTVDVKAMVEAAGVESELGL